MSRLRTAAPVLTGTLVGGTSRYGISGATAQLHDRHERRQQGPPELTSRQWEILRQVAAGHSNRQVARALVLSEATVRKHLEHIFMRLDVASRTAAVAKVTRFLYVA